MLVWCRVKERYALAAVMTLDKQGNLLHTRPVQTLIQSKYRLTYEEALAIIERKDEPGQHPEELLDAVEASTSFRSDFAEKTNEGGAYIAFS